MDSKHGEINIDKLLLTELSKDGRLVRRDIPIPHPHALTLSKLQNMCKNPNRTVLEMQDLFSQDIFSKAVHNVCLMYEYNNPYVNPVSYPKFMTYSKYCRLISDKRKTLEGISFQKVKVLMETYRMSLKEEFLEKAERYIYAEDYMSLYRQTVTLDSLKIISEEKIGWSVYEHKPNKNTYFKISTNYGYGRSAYFRVNMCYKGVDILPYSHVVTYAIAHMEDLVRATRNYSARRDNWPIAMDFMIETSNLALQNEEEFLKVWLNNEVDVMMNGLRKICSNPDHVMSEYKKKMNKPTPYLAVRNFTEKEVNLYKANQDEMNVSLKATKMSGALMFLDNLQEIAQVFGYVDTALTELKELAFSIIPEVNRLISALKMELKSLKKELESETFKLKSMERELKPFKLALRKLYKAQGATSHKEKQIIELKFKRMNIQYDKLLSDVSTQQEVVWTKEQFYTDRENFRNNLLNQRDLILSKTRKK